MTLPVSPRLVCTPAAARQVGQAVRTVYTTSREAATEIFANATTKNGETIARKITESRITTESHNAPKVRLPERNDSSNASSLPNRIQKKETEDHYTENRYGSGGIVGC